MDAFYEKLENSGADDVQMLDASDLDAVNGPVAEKRPRIGAECGLTDSNAPNKQPRVSPKGRYEPNISQDFAQMSPC